MLKLFSRFARKSKAERMECRSANPLNGGFVLGWLSPPYYHRRYFGWFQTLHDAERMADIFEQNLEFSDFTIAPLEPFARKASK